MNGLMDGFCTRRHWPALVGLMLALATGIAAFDTGAYSAPPVAAPRPDLSIDRLVGATQPPGAADPAGLTPRPADEQRERATSAPPPAPVADPAATARIQQGYGRLPMHFEPNQGQTADAVRYLARGAGYSLFLTDTEAVMVLRKPTAPAASHPVAGPAVAPGSLDGAQRNPGLTGTPANPDSSVSWGDLPWPGFWHTGPTDGELPFSFQDPNTPFSFQRSSTSFSFQRSSVGMLSWPLQRPEAPRDAGASRLAPTPERGSQSESETAVVRMRLTGATRNPVPAIAGRERQPGISNYIRGNDPTKWRSGVPHYARVHYDQVYPGIDLVYYGNPQQLEYDLVVAPGADPGQIRLSFEGVDGMRIDGEGNLVLAVASGEIVQKAPRIVQSVEGQERMVAGRYVMLDGENIGGVARDADVGMAGVDGERAVGFVLAAYDPAQVLVIDPVVVYSTFLGGGFGEGWGAIAVDAAGNAYVTGSTSSTDFPTANARYPNLRGQSDLFVTKLDPQGQGPVYSTYLGGSSNDGYYSVGIAVDAAGNAYLTGTTASVDFPTVNARYPNLRGQGDAFVIKLDPQGQGPVYSTYLGGSSYEDGTGIAVDNMGSAYVTGQTGSADFPTVHARYPNLRGYGDAFVTKLDPQGQGPDYSTYLGGSERYFEWGSAIDVDGAGNAYVTGITSSTDFPTINARYPNLWGFGDAFVTKFDPQGQGPIYSTYLGGSGGNEEGNAIAVDGAGSTYVTGTTDSADFPTVNAFYPTLSGILGAFGTFVTKFGPQGQGPTYSTYLGPSAMGPTLGRHGGIAVDGTGNTYVAVMTGSVTKLDPQGQGPVYSIFLGGSSYDYLNAITVDGAGNAYVTGSTSSSDFPTVNALYPNLRGASDAFVTKISPAGALDTPEQPVFADTPPLAAAPNLRKYLILLIHGWNSTPSVWAEPMKQTITQRLNPDYDKDPCVEPIVNGDISWQICSYDWREQAGYKSESDFNFMPGKFPPWDAQVNAGNVGKRLAERLVAGRYDFIHFIAHSAGGNVAESAAAWLRVRIQSYNRSQPQDPISAPIIHSTFFDAYDLAGNNSRYGSASNWAEQYVDSRVVAGGLPDGDQTRNVLPHAYNFDVTNLDPMQDAGLFGTHAHAWPYIWYQFTIDNTGVFKDTGFARSLEWWRDNPPSVEDWLAWTRDGVGGMLGPWPAGGHCEFKNLLAKSCSETPGEEPLPIVPICSDLFSCYTIDPKSIHSGGTGSWSMPTNNLMRMNTAGMAANVILNRSVAAAASEGQSGAIWLKIPVLIAEPVDFISFNYTFEGQAEGLLSAFVDDLLVFRSDQRVEMPGTNLSGEIPVGHLANGAHELSFRLDAFSDAPAQIDLSEVAFSARATSFNYTLTVNQAGTGSGTVGGGGTYATGAPVTLTATADTGSTFAGWGPSPCAASFTMPASDLTCTATFTLNSTTYALTLAKAGAGSGTVSGGGTYASGAPVTLTASADTGSTFSGWSPSPCAASFAMPANDLACTATFTLDTYALTLTKAGTGSGTVSGGGTFAAGAPVTLTATADTGSTFTGWSPSPCAGSFTMPASALTCSATFALNTYAITVTAEPVAGGTASCSPNPVDHGGTSLCTATPSPGYTFMAWSGDCTGASCLLANVTAAKRVSATFGFAIVTSVTPAGSGTVSCTVSPVAPGGTSLCTATANPGFSFTGWRGDCAGQAGKTCTLSNINSAKAVAASFVQLALVLPSRSGWRAALGH